MFLGWMIDIAREQSPPTAWLADLINRSAAAGYGALGLYLEHRYAYPSAPWAAAPGCLTPNAVRELRGVAAANGVRLIPFLNTLGHMEGFIRTRGGEWLAEGPAQYSAQICPSRDTCVQFARGLVADALDAFDDEWVHLGGDEARQLGQCPRCAERAGIGGPGALYANYYGDLCRWVLARGRRPCLWGDMLLKHPQALDALPPETLLFNWQYDQAPDETTRCLRQRGFEVINCPSIHSYHGPWCDLAQTEANIDAHVADARSGAASGVLLTTWELFTLATYESIIPLVMAAGRRISGGSDWRAARRAAGGEAYDQAAEILGRELHEISPYLHARGHARFRQSLIGRLDPFELWRRWRVEADGPIGERVAEACARAARLLDENHELWPPLLTMQSALLWVRLVERARRAYEHDDLHTAATELREAGEALSMLVPTFEAIAGRGGSMADPQRLRRILRHVERVAQDIESLPENATVRPSFATLVSPAYVPNAQAAWGTEWQPPLPPPAA